MNTRFWMLLFFFAIFTSATAYWFVYGMEKSNNEESKEVEEGFLEESQLNEKTEFSLYFEHSNPNPMEGKGWGLLRNELIGSSHEGKILSIIGPYSEDESRITGYENLGIVRAENLKKYFVDFLPDSLIQLRDKIVPKNKFDSDNGFINAASYISWIVNNDFVTEVDGRALIYFPPNSDKEVSTPQILKYLEDLATQLNSNTKQTVHITGHTDSDGSPINNYQLGLSRAEKIKTLLVSKGVEADRIYTTSKGEEFPVASNDTEEGKKANRRTEIITNK